VHLLKQKKNRSEIETRVPKSKMDISRTRKDDKAGGDDEREDLAATVDEGKNTRDEDKAQEQRADTIDNIFGLLKWKMMARG